MCIARDDEWIRWQSIALSRAFSPFDSLNYIRINPDPIGDRACCRIFPAIVSAHCRIDRIDPPVPAAT